MSSKGEGTVFSWIVVRHPVPRDVYAQDVPYVVALVELAEGVRIPSNIVGIAPADVTAGMHVEVVIPTRDSGKAAALFPHRGP